MGIKPDFLAITAFKYARESPKLSAMKDFRKYLLGHICTLFLVAAVFVHGISPPGFMPGLDSRGKASLVICTSTGTKTILVDHDSLPEKQNDKHDTSPSSGGLCLFASVLDWQTGDIHIDTGLHALEGAQVDVASVLRPLSTFVKPWQAQAPPV